MDERVDGWTDVRMSDLSDLNYIIDVQADAVTSNPYSCISFMHSYNKCRHVSLLKSAMRSSANPLSDYMTKKTSR